MSNTPSFDPTQQQQQPPVIQQQAYRTHSGHGSVGPVIGVLAVIMVLGAVAVMIGRLCSGRRIMGHVQYDFEGWVETKCSTCIDGRLGPPPPPPPVTPPPAVQSSGSNVSSSEAAAAATAAAGAPPPENLAGGAPPHLEELPPHHHHQQQHNLHEA